jgi:hypothetical protein
MTYSDLIAPPSNLASLGAAAGHCQATVVRPAEIEARRKSCIRVEWCTHPCTHGPITLRLGERDRAINLAVVSEHVDVVL